MEKLICIRNIEHFRRLLKNNPDEAERDVLESLIAEEEAKATNQQTAIDRLKTPA
jgi:hypothetical protein